MGQPIEEDNRIPSCAECNPWKSCIRDGAGRLETDSRLDEPVPRAELIEDCVARNLHALNLPGVSQEFRKRGEGF